VLQHAGGAPPGVRRAVRCRPLRARIEGRARYLRDIKPYLWRKGETYPRRRRNLNRLFVNGEIDFSMSYGPAFASERIARASFRQPSARSS